MTDHLVLSPHPDDGVWSLGGRIARWRATGESCAVVTVFDGAPGTVGEDWRQVAAPEVRREEDRRSLATLGTAHLRLGYPDAALRTSGSGAGARHRYSHPRRLFGPPHADDVALVARLREELAPLIATAAVVHVPLAAGHHVDHRLVRSAVEHIAPATTQWYEDFPYPLGRRDHEGLRPVSDPLDPADVAAWTGAAGLHASQALALLGGTQQLHRALLERAERNGREAGVRWADRYWVRALVPSAHPGGRPPAAERSRTTPDPATATAAS